MRIERPRKPELDQQLVAAYARTFIARHDRYPLQLPGGSYATVRKQLHPALIHAHLRGTVTLGAYALDHQSQAHWLCFDADDDERWQDLRQLAQTLSEQQVTAYLEASRRGGHLWLFTPRLPGHDIRRFGHQVLDAYHLEQIELYPKQNRLTTGPGSLVRLPLGFHRLTGQRYPLIDPQGEPLAETLAGQLALLADVRRVPQPFINGVLKRTPDQPSPNQSRSYLAEPPSASTPLSERLKAHISVYDYVSRYITLDARGRGHCIFHDDRRKSFSVNREQNYWHCFAGCGGGSIIDFQSKLRQQRGQDAAFVPTITELAEILL